MIFCNISLPNLLVLEIEVDSKAKGQECLDKVCERLGIVEVDYFGLRYIGNKGEHLWLNLRNRLSRQICSSAVPNQCRFQLRVKFFVQPHYLLQQTTRHLFYLHLKNDILTGACKFLDERNADTELDDTIVDPGASEEIHTTATDTTDDNASSNSSVSQTLSGITNSLLLIELCALIAQAERGNYNCDTNDLAVIYYDTMIPSNKLGDESFLVALQAAHSRLANVSRAAAESRLLRRSAAMQSYGVEYHSVKNAEGQPYNLGVGPEGISVYDQQWQMTRSVHYPLIKMATHKGRFMFLHTYKADGSTSVLGVKLVSEHGANALYRAVTEMHSFYRCDTVRGAVSAQFSRDLKGTLASLFNEDTTLGKKFVFDIRRTCRETYEYARRTLYRAEQLAAHANISSGATISVLPSVRMPGVNLASASVPAALDILSSTGGTTNANPDEATLRKLSRRRRRHRSSNSDEGGGGKLLRKEELEYGSNSASAGVRLRFTNRDLQTSSGVLSLVAEDVSVVDDADMDDDRLSDLDGDGESDEETQDELVERLRQEAAEETQMLKARLERLEDALQCRICLCQRVEAVFCPCGHAACCLECAGRVETCPLCRSNVERTQRIYLPSADELDPPISPNQSGFNTVSPNQSGFSDQEQHMMEASFDTAEPMDYSVIYNTDAPRQQEHMDDGLLLHEEGGTQDQLLSQ